MSILVSDLCASPLFRENIHLIAGRNGVSRVVTSITAMETADFVLGQPDTDIFVLTTFSYCHDDIEKMKYDLRTLSEGGAGMAIKVNRFIKTVPQELIDLADELNFPLFSFEELQFRNIILDVVGQIMSDQYKTIALLNEQHQLLYSALLSGEQLDSFFKNIGTKFDVPCLCISVYGELLAEYRGNAGDEYSSTVSALREHFAFTPPDEQSREPFVEHGWLAFPCITLNRTSGYFIVCKEELSPMEEGLAQQATSFVSIKLLENQILTEQKRQILAPTVNDLLLSSGQSAEEARDRLHLLNASIAKAYFILIFSSSDVESRAEHSLGLIQRDVQKLFKGGFAHRMSDGLVVYVPSDSSATTAIKKLKQSVKLICSSYFFSGSIGCSNYSESYSEISYAFRQARQALNFGKKFLPELDLIVYGEQQDLIIASSLKNTPEGQLLCQNISLPILEYDKQHGTQLWKTLGCCLRNPTLELAAEELFIHTSTLRYRLATLNKLTGYDFFSFQGKYIYKTVYSIAELS